MAEQNRSHAMERTSNEEYIFKQKQTRKFKRKMCKYYCCFCKPITVLTLCLRLALKLCENCKLAVLDIFNNKYFYIDNNDNIV